jgi:serine protease Do
VLSAAAAAESPAPAAPNGPDLRELERHAQAAAEKARPAVVAVVWPGPAPEHHESGASGVIISPDGLILSQFHVTHMVGNFDRSRRAGERATVVLWDGRRVEAELLGADRTYDLSLVRLLDKGPYPYAPLDGRSAVRVGDWVIKLGHPSGYRADRAAPVRLGRIVCDIGDTFLTDCAIDGGDSGGPYFDLDGRLVGIIRSDLGSRPLRATAPEFVRRVGALFTATPAGTVAARLEAMRGGDVAPLDAAVVSRWVGALETAEPLDSARWTQGALRSGRGWGEKVAAVSAGVVAVLDGTEVVALGTAVDDTGGVLTKASELPAEPRCRLPDGRVTAVAVAGADPGTDLALLRVKEGAAALRPVAWAGAPQLAAAAGTVVGAVAPGAGAATGPGDAPAANLLAVGVISVGTRELAGPYPQRLERPPPAPAAPPEVIGSPVQGRGYWVEYVEGAAADAGVVPGDVVLSIGGVPLRRHEDLAECVRGHGAGERLTVRLLRAGKRVECVLRLRAEGQRQFSGRRDDFPAVIEHDAPLLAHECGGPLVDLEGRVLGINIARVGPHGCMALPAGLVRKVLPDLLAGKLAANWVPPARRGRGPGQAAPATQPAPAAAGAALVLSLEELKGKLAERNDRFKSLFVEYDTTVSAQVEPSLLMAWGMHDVRDDRELHRVAFDGEKRLAEVRRPALGVLWAPRDQVAPDPAAPPEVARAVEQRRLEAGRQKEQGRTGHLFVAGGPPRRLVFDGRSCYVPSPDGKQMLRRPAEFFSAPTMYLGPLGLRPPDPGAAASQKQHYFPANFELYEQCRVLPALQVVDAAGCVVVEGQSSDRPADGKPRQRLDRIWFDPALGFSPRRREYLVDGATALLWRGEDFDEFAPGCFLPRTATYSVFTPTWAAPELRGRPAYTYTVTLRKARVGEVPAQVFEP